MNYTVAMKGEASLVGNFNMMWGLTHYRKQPQVAIRGHYTSIFFNLFITSKIRNQLLFVFV